MSYSEEYILRGLQAAALLRGRSTDYRSCRTQFLEDFEEDYLTSKRGQVLYENKVFDLTHDRFVLARDIAHWDIAHRIADLKTRYLALAPVQNVAKSKATFATPPTASLEERFWKQADKWKRETEHLSSPSQVMMHPSYQAILGMAQGHEDEMVRLMLRDLQKNRTPWFWALSYLTQENPIQRSEAGKMDKMIKAWVDWGKTHGKL